MALDKNLVNKRLVAKKGNDHYKMAYLRKIKQKEEELKLEEE